MAVFAVAIPKPVGCPLGGAGQKIGDEVWTDHAKKRS